MGAAASVERFHQLVLKPLLRRVLSIHTSFYLHLARTQHQRKLSKTSELTPCLTPIAKDPWAQPHGHIRCLNWLVCLGRALVAVWEHPKGVYILYNGLDVVHHSKAKLTHQIQQCHADVHSEEWLPSIGTPEPAHVACPVIAINLDWTMKGAVL